MPINYDLNLINSERRRKGFPPISQAQAYSAASSARNSNDGFSITDFLIGYSTGVFLPSPAGIMGASLHQSQPDPSPSYSSPDSSSSSFDSGGSSGGGFDGGGGSF